MRANKNIFLLLPLSLLLVFVPVLCCCLAGIAQAHGQERGVAADSHTCCDSQAPSEQPRHDSAHCDCQNHLLVKAANIVSGNLETMLAQDQSTSCFSRSSFFVLPNDPPRFSEVYQAVHSPPFYSRTPLYIEFRALRL